MASKVYFANMRANSRESSLLNKIKSLYPKKCVDGGAGKVIEI